MSSLAPPTRPHRTRLVADAALLLVAVIWGATFPVGKAILEHIGPFAYLAVRFTIATLLMLPFVPWREARRRGVWMAALGPGVALGAGYALQTAGLRSTDATIAAFITGLSVVLVPLLSRAAGRRPTPLDWLGAGTSLVGLALLTVQRVAWPSAGEALLFGCAVGFAAHIVLLDRAARAAPPAALTAGQMAVAAVFCGVLAPSEGPLIAPPTEIVAAIVGLAVFASAGAFLVQAWAQKFTTPTHVGLLFTAEPVAAAALAHWWFREMLTPRQWAGAALILGGIVLVVLAPAVAVAGRGKMKG